MPTSLLLQTSACICKIKQKSQNVLFQRKYIHNRSTVKGTNLWTDVFSSLKKTGEIDRKGLLIHILNGEAIVHTHIMHSSDMVWCDLYFLLSYPHKNRKCEKNIRPSSWQWDFSKGTERQGADFCQGFLYMFPGIPGGLPSVMLPGSLSLCSKSKSYISVSLAWMTSSRHCLCIPPPLVGKLAKVEWSVTGARKTILFSFIKESKHNCESFRIIRTWLNIYVMGSIKN